MYLRSGNTGMEDIADDHHFKLRKITLIATNGEHIEHGLCRMRVLAVTCVNDTDVLFNMIGNKVCRTGG